MAIVRAEMRVLKEEEVVDKASYYTALSKRISQMGSIALLETMSATDFENAVYEAFKEIVTSDPKPKRITIFEKALQYIKG